MNPEFFVKGGTLFSDERLNKIPTLPVWDCEPKAELARNTILDALEKNGDLLKADATEPQTQFFIVNPVLHALGYVYSVSEALTLAGDTSVRADYTLFTSAEDFAEVEPVRGTVSFFRKAIALCQATAWSESLDISDEPEEAAQQPMVLMDLFLRTSGVDFGFVTNGNKWRIVHRATSEGLKTFIEVDLLTVMKSKIDDFKWFYLLFGKDSLAINDQGTCLLNSFLAE